MDLIESLLIGGYLYTTAFGGWLWKRIDKLSGNHIKHLEQRVKALEDQEKK